MFLQHDLIEILGGDDPVDETGETVMEPVVQGRLRIIWADHGTGEFVYVDAEDPRSYPVVCHRDEALELIDAGRWRIVEGFAPIYPSDTDIPENHRTKRDADWEMIRPIIDRKPDVFVKMLRAKLINSAAKLHGTTKITIRKHLLRAFHGGMSANALLPGWDAIGNAGQSRPGKADGPKVGRPVTHGTKSGCNITEDIKRLFLIAADTYERNDRLDLLGAYHLCMRMFFSEVAEEVRAGRTTRVPTAEYEKRGLPRYEQFCYHVRKERGRLASERRRMGERIWALTSRPLLSDSTREAWGPGARYQIDATILDVYVRSRRDRRRLIGRPTLYVVIDVFSRMIVGFSISFDPPSWQAAMMALANAMSDKVAFCARYGIEIERSEWPCAHMCAILEGDRGEIESAKIDGLAQYVTIENAAAYRADWKGIVESRFRILQKPFGPYVDGYVQSDFRERGARDYRLDAVLDVDDITRLMIGLILYHNNYHEIVNYPKLPEMTADGVPAVPREMWNWGIANVGGRPRSVPEDVLRFKLLPRTQARTRREGIYHHGNFYTCEKGIREGWFVKGGARTLTISYDKRFSDEIYVHVPSEPKGFIVARLTPASRRSGMNGWEVQLQIVCDREISANRRDEQTLARASAEGDMDSIVDAARAKMREAGPQDSLASQVKGLRDAKQEELEHDREEDAAEYRAKMTGEVEPPAVDDESAQIIDIETAKSSDRYATPSMREILRRDSDKGAER